MAYIPYGQATVGGKQVAEAMADLQAVADKLRNLAGWINQIGPSSLESNTDFSVGTGQGQGFNDTFLQIEAAMNGVGGFMAGNREKVERLARGS